MKNYSKFKPKETIRDIQKLPSTEWPERGIRKEIMELFGVKVDLSEEFGGQIEKVYFPYYSQEDKLCGYKCKDLTKDKHEDYHYYTVGHVGVDCQLFGQTQCKGSKNNIRILEGETDFLSAYQVLLDRQQSDKTPDKYKHLKPQVVSIGCGTVQAVNHISNNLSFLNEYKNVWICFDNDELTEIEKKKKNPGLKGREAIEDVGSYLTTALDSDRNIFYIKWPPYFNDCSDALQRGKSEELAKILLFDKKEFQAEKIVGLYDKFEEGDLFKPADKGIYLNSFPKLMDKLLGIRMKESTLLLAPSGVGKTSVSAEIGYNFAEQCGGVGGIFLEEGIEKTAKRFISRRLKIHPNKYKFESNKLCTYEEYVEAERWVADKNNFLFIDHHGKIKIEKLVDLAKIFIYKYNRKFIVLDHISLLATADNQLQERPQLEKAMLSIAELCEQCDVHIMVVAHIKREASSVSKEDRKITKPTWKRTFITDGKGTQALEALAHNIIPIDVELLPDGSRGRIRLFVGKNREADQLGFADIVRMDNKTGVFYDASEEVWHPETEPY